MEPKAGAGEDESPSRALREQKGIWNPKDVGEGKTPEKKVVKAPPVLTVALLSPSLVPRPVLDPETTEKISSAFTPVTKNSDAGSSTQF